MTDFLWVLALPVIGVVIGLIGYIASLLLEGWLDT